MRVGLLLGDEAIAQAAIEAGIGGAFSYPGTPSTEIFEYLQVHLEEASGISVRWSANEKVAYEAALGMSYAGRRALVSMKHVGLNVAADPFMSSALTGVNAGMVLVVADDPGMHSSQNEQDSRFFGEFAQIPIFEPCNQQEAYDMTLEAFSYSEEVGLPVMVRIVTRLAHSRSNVKYSSLEESGNADLERRPLPDPNDWVLVPLNARRRYRHLLDMQDKLLEDSERAPKNTLKLSGRRGVIAAGLAYNYLREALNGTADLSVLKISQYPIPVSLVRKLVGHCSEIVVAEEGYPFIERRLNGVLGLPGKAVKGKLTGDLPLAGELTPDVLAAVFGRPWQGAVRAMDGLANRPPQLCRGCPHTDSFKALVEATAGYSDPILFSDIGCYALGVLPPFRAVHSCVDMGSSIAMSHGAARAGVHPVICTIGDSTFAHSGMTGLIGAAQEDADMTVLILDNATVAMTGAQESMTTGSRLLEVIRGLGVDEAHTHIIEPHRKHHKDNVALLKKEIEHHGLSVIVPTRPCIHVKPKQARAETK